MLSRRIGILNIAAAAVSGGLLLNFLGYLDPSFPLEFSGLLLAGILISAFATQPASTEERATMPASFVVEFTALLVFGPYTTLLVVLAGALAREFADSQRPHQYLRTLTHCMTAAVATQAAGFAHRALGGTLGHFEWPSQGVPIAAAILSYSIVKVVAAEVIRPLLLKKAVRRSWPNRILLDSPMYFIAGGIAVGFVEIIDHRVWALLPVALLPLYCTLRIYRDYMGWLDEAFRRGEVLGSLDQGLCVIDHEGRVTLWNDALERITGITRDRALGHTLVATVPALGNTELPKAISDAATDRKPRTIPQLRLSCAEMALIVRVKVLPVPDGVTLVCLDITDQSIAERTLRRSEERLALAAAGANDGWWEWDLRTQECYFSARWRELLGIAGGPGVGKPDEWLSRVHAEDVAALNDALKTHLAGKTPHFEHEHRIRHADGSYRWFLARGVAGRAIGRTPARIAGSLTDKTEQALAQQQLRSADFRDPLTGLRNRADFVEGLGRRFEEFKQAQRGGVRFAVLYLDLDRFKIVNDSLGHLVGDELLIAVSRRLESCLRPGDSLARLGGDEFAILLQAVGDEQQANVIAFQIQEALRAPIMIAGRELFTSASIGIAFGTRQHSNPDDIMRDADTAMYHAKAHGKARHELFDADMHARTRDRLGLENDLRHAVSNHEFEVQYQPIVLLSSGMCVGFESLIRWSRNGEPVSPATFIPMAEELGLIESIGTWVLQHACQTFADWQRQFPNAGLDYITVNVSSRQLMQQNFVRLVEVAVETAGLKPSDLRLEITETALLDSPASAAEVLRQLRDFGAKIYLDDFGTGYSSLSHLHKLPVDALKIDRSFVKSLMFQDRPAIVESILALARTLNTSVVAEGIETDLQARELERLGCTHAQGFLFSRPLTMEAAEQLIVAKQPLGPKRPQTIVVDEIERCYAKGPFKWPDHIQPRQEKGEDAKPVLAGPVV